MKGCFWLLRTCTSWFPLWLQEVSYEWPGFSPSVGGRAGYPCWGFARQFQPNQSSWHWRLRDAARNDPTAIPRAGQWAQWNLNSSNLCSNDSEVWLQHFRSLGGPITLWTGTCLKQKYKDSCSPLLHLHSILPLPLSPVNRTPFLGETAPFPTLSYGAQGQANLVTLSLPTTGMAPWSRLEQSESFLGILLTEAARGSPCLLGPRSWCQIPWYEALLKQERWSWRSGRSWLTKRRFYSSKAITISISVSSFWRIFTCSF